MATRFLDIEADSSIALGHLRDRFAAVSLPQPVDTSDDLEASLTVVICTRDRREGLSKTLASLAGQSDSGFEVRGRRQLARWRGCPHAG